MAVDPEFLCGWTIYDRPLDFPLHWAVRMWFVVEPGVTIFHACACLCESLEEAREQIPAGAICFPREDDDDVVIYETWI